VYEVLRRHVEPVEEDRALAPDIGVIVDLMESGALTSAAAEAVGDSEA